MDNVWRFALVDESADDAPVRLAVCTDVAGVFTDQPPPPARERYVLLGCEPAGALLTALSGIDTDDAWVGGLSVCPDHGSTPPPDCRSWGEFCDCAADLVDVRVLAARPSGDGLWDLHLDGDPWLDDSPEEAPPAVAFRLFGSDGPYGTCRSVTGVYRQRAEPPEHPVRLVGCVPSPALAVAMVPHGEPGHRHAFLHALTRDGDEVALPISAGLCLDGEVRPWASDLVDVHFAHGLTETMPTGARAIWDLWFDGGPTEPNLWAPYDSTLRFWWAGAAMAHHTGFGPDRPPGGTYHLDGRHVTDLNGFFCALGEAINGPGGYFGWNLSAVEDCLRGRFGAASPFHLVWHDADVAREHLVVRRRSGVAFDALLDLLRLYGSTVEL